MINTMDKSSENMQETQNVMVDDMYLEFVRSEVITFGYSVRNEMHVCYLIVDNINKLSLECRGIAMIFRVGWGLF